jgi:hypothetical protein
LQKELCQLDKPMTDLNCVALLWDLLAYPLLSLERENPIGILALYSASVFNRTLVGKENFSRIAFGPDLAGFRFST